MGRSIWWDAKLCTKIEGKDKLSTLKLDGFLKHGGIKKTLVVVQVVGRVGEFYINKDIVIPF
jgi:hypothetical protein